MSVSSSKSTSQITLTSAIKPVPLTRSSASERYILITDPIDEIKEESKDPLPSETPSGSSTMLKNVRLLMAPRGGKNRMYTTKIGLASSITTNGSGFVDSQIAISAVTAIAEFTTFAFVFDEFFVNSATAHFVPQYKYQSMGGVSSTTQGAHQAMAVYSLFHGNATYSTLTGAASCQSVQFVHSGTEWKHKWINNENKKSGVSVVSSTSTATPTQGWCNTSATPAALYAGSIQILSDNTQLLSSVSQKFGVIFTVFDITFRTRA